MVDQAKQQQQAWHEERLKQAREEGRANRDRGGSLKGNPYSAQISPGIWQAWRKGWKARDEELIEGGS